MSVALPTDKHITYQQQYRKCGKADCRMCREKQGHGPYFYGYYRENGKVRSRYIGKELPEQECNMSVAIPLTKGKVALVSVEDAELAKLNWHCRQRRSNGGIHYCAINTLTENGERKSYTIMHHIILERMLGRSLSPHERAGHLDGNTLNNQRKNLYLCTQGQITQKGTRLKRNQTGYRGVRKARGVWSASIYYKRVNKYLGCYPLPELAARAYDQAALELFGKNAKRNFL